MSEAQDSETSASAEISSHHASRPSISINALHFYVNGCYADATSVDMTTLFQFGPKVEVAVTMSIPFAKTYSRLLSAMVEKYERDNNTTVPDQQLPGLSE